MWAIKSPYKMTNTKSKETKKNAGRRENLVRDRLSGNLSGDSLPVNF